MSFASHSSSIRPSFSFDSANKLASAAAISLPRICRKSLLLQTGRHDGTNRLVCALSFTEILHNVVDEARQLPKEDTWSVHKFGGTCVGTPQRIQNVADIVLMDNSERKVVLFYAMSKVTDMMYDLIEKAQSRNEDYVTALEGVLEKHRSTALEILDGEELAGFLSRLHRDIYNLKAMLCAIYIDAWSIIYP